MIQTIAATGFDPMVIVMWVALGLIIWFFMIRPNKKRQQEIQNFRNSITVGTKVVTAGGIHAEVRSIDELNNILVLEIDKGVTIRVDRNSVYATAQQDQSK